MSRLTAGPGFSACEGNAAELDAALGGPPGLLGVLIVFAYIALLEWMDWRERRRHRA